MTARSAPYYRWLKPAEPTPTRLRHEDLEAQVLKQEMRFHDLWHTRLTQFAQQGPTLKEWPWPRLEDAG